jgi:hypothetical protein
MAKVTLGLSGPCSACKTVVQGSDCPKNVQDIAILIAPTNDHVLMMG